MPAAPVCADKDDIAHWDGDPSYGDEYSERAWRGYYSCTSAEVRKAYALRLKNAVSGSAWRLMHTPPELAVTKLVADAETKPEETVELFTTVVCDCCLRKREDFNNFFRRDTRNTKARSSRTSSPAARGSASRTPHSRPRRKSLKICARAFSLSSRTLRTHTGAS